MTRYAVVVPPVPALLPEYAGISDPLPELRKACRAAVSWLADRSPARVSVLGDPCDAADLSRGVAEPVASRVARALLGDAGFVGEIASDAAAESDAGLLVLANGSARRSEKAPGHVDERSFGFDERLEAALAVGDSAALRATDVALGAALLAAGLEALRTLGGATLTGDVQPTMLYADDPFGVRYWVVTWECAS